MNNPHFKPHTCQMVAHGTEGRSLILHSDGHMYVVDTNSTHRGLLTRMVLVGTSSRDHFARTVAKGVDFVIECVDMV